MPINQQLKDYISQQTKLGVSKDAIKSSLLEAGWNEGDVIQAIAEAESGTRTTASLTPAQPFSKPVEPAAKSPTTSFVTSDIFKAKNEPVFQSAVTDKPSVSNSSETKPQIISASMKDKLSGVGKLPTIILGILSVALLGGNIYFFMQNGNLNSKLVTLSVPNGNDSPQLQTQIDSLTNDKKTLTDQIDSFNKTIADLSNQISIFIPAVTSSIVSVPFEVSGTLGGGGKLPYSLTTSKNIVLSVKNSKDTDVEASLKQFVGMQTKLSGTHQPGSISLTVVNVNDQPVNATSTTPVAQSSSTPSSSASTSSASGATSTSGTSTSSATSTP